MHLINSLGQATSEDAAPPIAPDTTILSVPITFLLNSLPRNRSEISFALFKRKVGIYES